MEQHNNSATSQAGAGQLLDAIIGWRAMQAVAGKEEIIRMRLQKQFAHYFGCTTDQVRQDQLEKAVDELAFIVYDRLIFSPNNPEERLKAIIKNRVGKIVHDQVFTTAADVDQLVNALELAEFFRQKEVGEA
ncbi:hypothetical protein BVH01_10525 [Pseudomonas sp. PA1(2017)]|uniref:hypothetical protein n=1 Tax=Pseudomonas sp. PA1(2017) TaxID=1932113 RepID=UPI000961A04D|nr:hypothetical protein [Pseudomonas sp. PA1(2017)]OLU16987.1 hypothetical protein BVH01_10525 [Pseudomonas sp. PA1(2017)]